MRTAISKFGEVRNGILADIDRGIAEKFKFEWPELGDFNWALDWFDEYSQGNRETALVWRDEENSRGEVSYDALRDTSTRVAGWLMRQGVGPGTRVLVSLESSVELWEIMLAIIKLNAVIVPFSLQGGNQSMMEVAVFSGATVIVSASDIAQEIPLSLNWIGIAVGGAVSGWLSYEDARSHKFARRRNRQNSRSGAPLILECRPGGSGGDRIRSWRHSHYASTVGRLADLYFTRLIPGGRCASFARAGSMDYLWFSFLGPLTSGATTITLEGSALPEFDSIADHEHITSAYLPFGCVAMADAMPAETDVFTSVTREDPGCRRILAAPRKTTLSALPQPARWGMRHHQTSTAIAGTMASAADRGKLAEVLPGHELELVPPFGEEHSQRGEVWVHPSNWPASEEAAAEGSEADASRTAGHSFRTGFFGRRVSDRLVAIEAVHLGPDVISGT